jgi:chemotaxis methyl-accepting protein methylase
MNGTLARIAEVVGRETGIVIKEPQLPALAAALSRIAPGMDAEHFLAELGAGPSSAPLISRLIDEVTVKETYFFRQPQELRALDWRAALETARTHGSSSVRVWVSACATGEEAYTLAILAADALDPGSPPVTVLATDISAAALERAEAARYSERALRGVPDEVKEHHFVRDGDRYRVGEAIRSLVRFRRHNLVRDAMPPLGEVPFEVIACRNVLIYFEPAMVELVVDRLETALRVDGTLILGAADRLGVTARRHSRDGPVARPTERRGVAKRPLRRPLGLDDPSAPEPASATERAATERPRAEDPVEDALLAADAGDLDATLAITAEVLDEYPFDADAHFVHGLAELGRGDAGGAAYSFRRATYVDPSFGLAAFELGRAHESRGDASAARSAYRQALRTLDPGDDRHRVILDYVELSDVAAACRGRLRALSASSP